MEMLQISRSLLWRSKTASDFCLSSTSGIAQNTVSWLLHCHVLRLRHALTYIQPAHTWREVNICLYSLLSRCLNLISRPNAPNVKRMEKPWHCQRSDLIGSIDLFTGLAFGAISPDGSRLERYEEKRWFLSPVVPSCKDHSLVYPRSLTEERHTCRRALGSNDTLKLSRR